jgi:transposase
VGERKPYKTDLTKPEWAVIKPLIVAWKAAHPSVSGHQGRYEMREIVNALRYQNRTGCQWELLPHDLPPTGAVRYYFDVWKRDGLDQRINELLRMMCARRPDARGILPRWCSTRSRCARPPGCRRRPRAWTRRKVGALAARLREAEAEREALAITAKTVRTMAAGLDLEQPPPPGLPDGAAYQQIMAVFEHERRPLRARDLCLALDPPVLPKHVEGNRVKLKRLVSLGFLDETEPGLFQQPSLQARTAPTDQRS